MKTAILIVNWNGGSDTIACLSSLMPILSADDYVFIIDNASTDASLQEIRAYYEAKQQALIETDNTLNRVFNAQQKHYLVTNGANVGFGAGNNVVLKQLPGLQAGFRQAWLLNNDALVSAKSLEALKQALQKDKDIGAAGSLILNYPDTETIQCSGVNHYKFFGVSKLVNKNRPYKNLDPKVSVKFDYLNGASLMLNLVALEKTGGFDERFFLYSEELDLQLRLQAKGYKLYLEPESVIYHKLGGSTGANRHLFFYYYNTSAMLLSKKHYPGFYTCCAVVNLTAITLVRTFPSVKRLIWGIKGIITGLKK